MEGLRRALVAIAAGLALADASIVALALPPILIEMDTTISGVAAIIGVYALVLAVSIWPAARVRVGPWGFALFALASFGCGLSGSLEVLLVFRALQAVGGAAALIAAFVVLDVGSSRSGRRLWLGAALIGTAAGPALGGALTEVFDWRAIFIIQAPLAAAAALATLRRAPRVAESRAAAAPPRAAGGAPAAAHHAEAAPTWPPPAGEPPVGGLWARSESPAKPARLRDDAAARRLRDDTAARPLRDDAAPAPVRDDIAPAPVRDDTAPAPVRDDTAPAPPRRDAAPAPVRADT